jgi:hypothetical protein
MLDTTKIIVIIFIAAVIVLLIINLDKLTGSGKTYNAQNKECYNAPFDSAIVDPRKHPYSRDIAFRPDDQTTPSLDDDVVNDATKIFTHLADQEYGVNVYGNTADTDPSKRFSRGVTRLIKQDGSDNTKRQGDQGAYDVDGIRVDTKEFSADIRYAIDDDRLVSSSYRATDINGELMLESNNYVNTCAVPTLYQSELLTRTVDVPLLLGDDIDIPYSNILDKVQNPDMSDEDYHKMLKERTELKLMVRDCNDLRGAHIGDEDDYDKLCEGTRQFEDLDNVVKRYRSNTLGAIDGEYRGYSATNAVRNGMKMYDIVDRLNSN